MGRKKKAFDAVKMVREIRDAHYEQTKDMTKEERIAFYRNKAQELNQELDKRRGRTPA